MNIAVITGASSGIGEQFLRQLVLERSAFGSVPFEEIWVIARRVERLFSLKNELDPVRIRIFNLDLISSSAVADMAEELKKRKPSIGLLVNCAGVGKNGRFETLPSEDVHRMVALNCAALAEFTSICLPYMIPTGDLCSYATGPRILNIASSAGFLPQPGFSVYAASKSFVISFSRALHAELRIHNIASTTVCPGPVATEFASVATGVPGAKTEGFKSLFVVKPARLVKKSILASKRGRGLYVYGFSQKVIHVLSKILPVHFLVFLMTKLFKDARAPSNSQQVTPDTVQVTPDTVQASAAGTGTSSLQSAPIQASSLPTPAPTPAPVPAQTPPKQDLPASANGASAASGTPGTSEQALKILSMYPGKSH